MRRLFLTLCVVATLTGGSITSAKADNAFWGTGVGAALGGLVGSQFGGHRGGQLAYTGLGVVAGGLIGNSIGSSMDRSERAYSPRYYSGSYGEYVAPTYYNQPTYYYQPNYVAPPAPYPQQIIYQEPVIIPSRSVELTSPDYCREYSQQINIGGQLQETYGTACLQPDGSWRIVH